MASNKTWKSRFTYSSKNAVEHEVNGNTLRFYPNRIGLLTELAEISKPIAHAMATLMGENQDRASVSKNQKQNPKRAKDGTESAEFSSDEIVIQAVSVELADHRRKERDGAIDELLDGLTNKRNRLMLGALLMDSLREEFEFKKERPPAEIEEFLFGDGEEYQGIDMPILVEMVKGWLKANSKVFGAMGEQMGARVKAMLGALQNPSTSEGMTSPTDGSSSKTPSSPESDSALESSISSS